MAQDAAAAERSRHTGRTDWKAGRDYAIALGRGFAGAILFGLPLLMTMEMWRLGFSMDRMRLALFLALNVPVLVALSSYAGMRRTLDLVEDVVDGLTAYAVGFAAAAAGLGLLGLLTPDLSPNDIVGRVSLQAVPASIGAIVARKQLGQESGQQQEVIQQAGYGGELFLMGAGALFFAFNVAPTEEMVLISYRMTEWHAVVLAMTSLLVMHALVYSVGFGGQSDPNGSFLSVFTRFTVVGYALALLVSLYVLWTFARTDGMSAEQIVMVTLVLGFPAALGAAVARLVL